ncbi:MAG TPA: flagellar motor protein MotB [Rhizomicrobium sp.]|jgi:chemotaxis protein MotB|nr:flagellar motor protein MotB [Rhizomicrobium sp.]
MAGDNVVVIKRIKKGGHGGHHGGAWKVAYADFVTAMMAFFLLMWLINTTTPEQKRGIADYFAPQSIAQTVSGSGGVLGGKVMGEDDAHAGGAQSVMQKQSPPAPPSKIKAMASGATAGGAGGSQTGTGADSTNATPSTQDGDFAHAAEAIRQAVQDNPDLANLSHQVILENTPQGLRVQLVDQDGRPMFQPGSSEPMPYTKKLLAAVGGIIATLPNRVSISGHTGGNPEGTADNWDLSSARANQARALLQSGGLKSDRIYEVAGKAGSEPLLPEDPNASANRRLSILLMREAPPAPPGKTL